MRAFIAIDMDENLRENCRRVINKFMASDADVKWVKPNNMHLTVKFLGEINEVQAESIKKYLDDIASETKVFETSFSGIGFFPNEKRPRVIWIGISKGAEELRRLSEKIDEKTNEIGIEKEKRGFSAHLTLGRFRSPKNLSELMKIVEKSREFDAGLMTANGVHLIQSVLKPTGPVYAKVHTATFK